MMESENFYDKIVTPYIFLKLAFDDKVIKLAWAKYMYYSLRQNHNIIQFMNNLGYEKT